MIKMDVYNQPIEVDDIPDNNDIDIIEFMNNDRLKFIDIIKNVKLPMCNFDKPLKLSGDTPLSFSNDTLITELMKIDTVTDVKIDLMSLTVYCNGTVCKPVDDLLRDEQFQVKPYVIYIQLNDSYYPCIYIIKQNCFNYDSILRFDSNDGINHISPHPNISDHGEICYGDEDLIIMYRRNKNLPMLIVSIIDFMKWCYIGSSYFNPFIVDPCKSCPYIGMNICRLCKCQRCEFRRSYQCNNCDDKYTITDVYNSVYGNVINVFDNAIADIQNTWRYYDITDYDFDATAHQIVDILNVSLDTFELNGIVTINTDKTTNVLSGVHDLHTHFKCIHDNVSENTLFYTHTEFEIMEIVYQTENIYNSQLSDILYKMRDLRYIHSN